MTTPSNHLQIAVIPAAGLGTRLLPATLCHSKELLPLGRYPALCATLLEAQGAGVTDLRVVIAPGKDDLRRFLSPETWGTLGERPEVAPLRHLLGSFERLQIIEQPEPLGVLDAISRGLPKDKDHPPCAILYPDLIHLPDQRALCSLWSAHQQCGRSVYALYQGAETPRPHGPTVRVSLAQQGPLAVGQACRILHVEPPTGPPLPGEIRTTFGTLHTAEFSSTLERRARGATGHLLDERLCEVLNELAQAGGLYGVVPPGEVLDLGQVAGYLDAVRRFAEEATLRIGG